jgi:predicted NAD/FAD-binding protein
VLDPAQAHVYKGMTLGQYLQEQGYSEAFKNNYVLPMCAAVWSVPNATVSVWTAVTGMAWGNWGNLCAQHMVRMLAGHCRRVQ